MYGRYNEYRLVLVGGVVIESAGKRILLVDDDVLQREMLAELLIIAGFSLHQSCNGIDALSALEQHKFDAVITDVQMPSMDGVTFLVEMRQRNHAIPVIITSSSEAYKTAAIKAGAAFFVLKPSSADRYAELLRRVLDKS